MTAARVAVALVVAVPWALYAAFVCGVIFEHKRCNQISAWMPEDHVAVFLILTVIFLLLYVGIEIGRATA